MKILLVSATPFEIGPLTQFLKQSLIEFQPNQFQKGPNGLDILITGVGMPATIFSLTDRLSVKAYDLIINAGIAGSFNKKIDLGSVWQVVEDRFGDLGVELADGSFEDVFDIELTDVHQFPFTEGKLVNKEGEDYHFLPKATAITVNKVHGFEPSIERIRQKYTVDLESMEGAAVFFVAQQKRTNCLQIRAVSNYVEARNREAWEIGLAIDNLNQILVQIISSLL